MKNRKIRFGVMIILLTFVVAPAWSASLDLGTAVAYAIHHSLEIESAELIKQLVLDSTNTNAFLPSLGAVLSVGNTYDPTTSGSSTFSIDAGLSLQWSLSGSKIMQNKIHTVSRSQAYSEYHSSVAEVEQETISSYWNLVELHAAMENAVAFLDYTESTYNQIKERYEASRTTGLQLAQAKLSLSSAELALQQAGNTYTQEKQSFLNNLGLERDQNLEFEELPQDFQLDFSRVDTLIDNYLYGAYAVQSATLAVDSAKLTEKSTRLDATAPSISTMVSTNLQQISSSGNSATSLPIQFSASVTIPLDRYLPRSASAIAVKQSGTEVVLAQVSLASVKNNLKQQVESLATSLTHQQMNHRVLQDNLALSREMLELMTESYHAGLSSFSDLESARKERREAEQSLLSSQVSYILDCYALAWLLNISYDELVREIS